MDTSGVQALSGLKDAHPAHYEHALSDYASFKQPLASVTCTMHCYFILLIPRSRCNLYVCLFVQGLVWDVLPELCVCVCVCVCVSERLFFLDRKTSRSALMVMPAAAAALPCVHVKNVLFAWVRCTRLLLRWCFEL